MDIEDFLECDHKPPVDHVVDAYRKAVKEMDAEQAKLMRFLRVKDGKAIFLDGVTDVQPAVQKADDHLENVRSGIKEFLGCLGDEYSSVTAMTEKLARMKRSLANIEHDVQAVGKRELTGSKKDISVDAESLKDKRDRMLSKRIAKAHELLGRYKA